MKVIDKIKSIKVKAYYCSWDIDIYYVCYIPLDRLFNGYSRTAYVESNYEHFVCGFKYPLYVWVLFYIADIIYWVKNLFK